MSSGVVLTSIEGGGRVQRTPKKPEMERSGIGGSFMGCDVVTQKD